uniref:protein disulfide-isomerase n=1 Tax=Stegastes partitus TaxID=144197 RepID=A0A3B5B9K4_9TELE
MFGEQDLKVIVINVLVSKIWIHPCSHTFRSFLGVNTSQNIFTELCVWCEQQMSEVLKKDVKYHYLGPRTKDGIMDFTNRVAGPLVRSLSSLQLFQHAMSRHDVMFVYVGATSQLKANYTSAAETLIVGTYFFSATRDVLPKAVSLASLPAVVVFKDGTYFTYSEEHDGDLKLWINRERFPNFCQIDSYTLYAMGESGNSSTPEHDSDVICHLFRYKSLVEKVAAEHRDTYSSFYFGFMEDSGYINGLVMGEVIVPSFIIVNLSNDGYFLPLGAVETERHLLDFMDGVLDGSVEIQGGNSITQRFRRFFYDAKVTPIFTKAPLLGCFLFGVPLVIGAALCFVCCKGRNSADDDDDDGVALLAPSLQQRKKSTVSSVDSGWFCVLLRLCVFCPDVMTSNGFCLANSETILFDLTPPTQEVPTQSDDSTGRR